MHIQWDQHCQIAHAQRQQQCINIGINVDGKYSSTLASTATTLATTLATTASILTTLTATPATIWSSFCQPILLSNQLVPVTIPHSITISSNPNASLNFIERGKHGLTKKRVAKELDEAKKKEKRQSQVSPPRSQPSKAPQHQSQWS